MTVDELKTTFGVKTDEELGAVFNRKGGAVSVWRSKGVPPAIEVKARDLMTRPGEAFDIPLPSAKIPIVSWAQGGLDGYFEDSHLTGAGFGEINRPYDITDPNAYALIISGDSMSPKFEPGDIVVVSPAAGHSSILTTQKYLAIRQQRLKEAMERHHNI